MNNPVMLLDANGFTEHGLIRLEKSIVGPQGQKVMNGENN